MIGGDLLYKDFKYNGGSNDGSTLLYSNKNEENSISLATCVVIILNSALVDDPFFVPGQMLSGFMLTIFVGVFVLILTQLSFHIFVKTWAFNQLNSHVSIWQSLYGKYSSVIPKALLLLAFISNSSVSVRDNVDQFHDLFSYFSPDSVKIVNNDWLIKYLFTFILTIPALLHPRLGKMKIMCAVALTLLLISLLCEAVLMFKTIKVDSFDPQKQIRYWSTDFRMMNALFDTFNTVYFSHPFVALISDDLYKATRSKITKMTWIISICSFLLLLSGGFFGYFTFFDSSIDDNILFGYSNTKDPFLIIAKICCLLKTALANNMFVFIATVSVLGIFTQYNEKLTILRIFVGIVIWTLVMFINYSGTGLMKLVDLLGGYSFMLLAYFLPSIFFLSMYKFKYPGWSILCIGVLLVSSVILGWASYCNVGSYIKYLKGE
ncbi:hypothetical protein TVAG_198050 [Trichomonas vaginalis G3]|uniref:Amino acid transporter transmembrane domain-containing protein n=1 Tax=Trichomonas vaginalis (strain ATCC PRA-98 / G3) TaxID=412133 RepID=A2DDJ2_TRIV3|nr:amino acid transporter family [Trichomonas vaginalis G3]EAY21368.1 hypothetical protein TVAG_198050 [Trichomonas vaginalis G3]KAI5490581.1 amino acid transporter family [Trichomonas vaginalis G3]|eukprot:XP_001582354.1 hypothetical protein [Trichomonas vaginalis G3]